MPASSHLSVQACRYVVFFMPMQACLYIIHFISTFVCKLIGIWSTSPRRSLQDSLSSPLLKARPFNHFVPILHLPFLVSWRYKVSMPFLSQTFGCATRYTVLSAFNALYIAATILRACPRPKSSVQAVHLTFETYEWTTGCNSCGMLPKTTTALLRVFMLVQQPLTFRVYISLLDYQYSQCNGRKQTCLILGNVPEAFAPEGGLYYM